MSVKDFLEYDQKVKKAAGRPPKAPPVPPKLFDPSIAGKTFGKGLIAGAGTLAAGVALSGAMTLGAQAIQAATSAINRSRGYKRMLEVHPDLTDRDEEQVKGMYNLLHKTAPTMAMNPHVAGGFIRRTEHASQYVDPKMISDLAGAEAKIRAVSSPTDMLQSATKFMPSVSLGQLE